MCASRRSTTKNVEKKKALAAEFVAHVRGNRLNAPHISELATEMMERFGITEDKTDGLKEFSVFWYHNIKDAAQDKPGGKTVLDACKAICNLVMISTEHRISAPDVEDLTDYELEAQFKELGLKLASVPEEEDDIAAAG